MDLSSDSALQAAHWQEAKGLTVSMGQPHGQHGATSRPARDNLTTSTGQPHGQHGAAWSGLLHSLSENCTALSISPGSPPQQTLLSPPPTAGKRGSLWSHGCHPGVGAGGRPSYGGPTREDVCKQLTIVGTLVTCPCAVPACWSLSEPAAHHPDGRACSVWWWLHSRPSQELTPGT